ncbi:MAG: COX15/CtaA family protein [Bryobacteraceae bacterium]
MGTPAQKRFAKFAWAVLVYNIPVILWGAYVRVSFSGDGCGAHWPFCNGQMIPQNMGAPMAIEFTHRMMTTVDSVAVIAMCVWAFRAFPRRHVIRLFSLFSLAFLFVEALLGAGLVLLRYVAKDQSAGRAWYLSAHLTNTMLLLAALTVTAWAATRNADRLGVRNASRTLIGALLVVVFVSITGAIAALGDTLFPASSLSAGMRQDFSGASNLLLRLRLAHPVIAVLGAAYLIWAATSVLKQNEASHARTAAGRVLGLTLFQLAVGAINLTLLAPVWMQLFHLFMADILWIALLLLVLEMTVVQTPMDLPVSAGYRHV